MVEKLAHFVYVIDEIKEACGDAYEKEKPRNNCPVLEVSDCIIHALFFNFLHGKEL